MPVDIETNEETLTRARKLIDDLRNAISVLESGVNQLRIYGTDSEQKTLQDIIEAYRRTL